MKEKLKGIAVFFILCFSFSGVLYLFNNSKSKIKDHFGLDFYFVDFSVLFFRNRECKRQYRDFCFFKIKIESEAISDIVNMPLPIRFKKWEEANDKFPYYIDIITNFEGFIRSPEENNEIAESHVDDFYALDKKGKGIYYLFSFTDNTSRIGYRIYIFNLPKKELTFFQCPWKLNTEEEKKKERKEHERIFKKSEKEDIEVLLRKSKTR